MKFSFAHIILFFFASYTNTSLILAVVDLYFALTEAQ